MDVTWRRLRWLAFLLVAAGIGSLLLVVESTRDLEVSRRGTPEQGHAFVVSLPLSFTLTPADGDAHPRKSRVRIYEDGALLGAPHSLHDEIRQLGAGRYSHWGQSLYLSASDNTDPRANGRRYVIEFERRLPKWLGWVSLGSGLALVLAAAVEAMARRFEVRRSVLRAAGPQVAGIVLMAVGASLVVGCDPPTTGPTKVPGYSLAVLPRLSGWGDPAVQRLAGEPDHEFVRRVTRAVSEKVYHCDYHNTPRLADWVMSKALGSQFRDVGILTPSALRCGWCNQVSYVLARVLRNGGIEADLLVLNGHVVTVAQFGDRKWIADADFGVGPVEYPPTFEQVRGDYLRTVGEDQDWMRQLARAYATSLDDTSYFRSMSWLDEVERKQRMILKGLVAAAWMAVSLGLCLFAYGSVRMRRALR